MQLEWSGQDVYRREKLMDWSTVDGIVAGGTKSGGGLTFATILGAGHMVRCPPFGFLVYIR